MSQAPQAMLLQGLELFMCFSSGALNGYEDTGDL